MECAESPQHALLQLAYGKLHTFVIYIVTDSENANFYSPNIDMILNVHFIFLRITLFTSYADKPSPTSPWGNCETIP